MWSGVSMRKNLTLITYSDCVKQNKALLREEKKAAKKKEVNIKQLASNVAYARKFGITFALPPEMEQLVKEHLIKQQS